MSGFGQTTSFVIINTPSYTSKVFVVDYAISYSFIVDVTVPGQLSNAKIWLEVSNDGINFIELNSSAVTITTSNNILFSVANVATCFVRFRFNTAIGFASINGSFYTKV